MVPPGPERTYRIERYLAEGGMGAIYLGKRIGAGGFEKDVVLKQLLPEFTSRPEFRDLFFREARISASLDHVNIVRTYDLVSSDDALFIVMEYVPGSDLRTVAWRAKLKRRRLSAAAVLHVASEILAGLAYAHRKAAEDGSPLAVVHRDVSPSNILCSVQGDVKLSDFGIAKAASASSVFYRVRGKVGYMSPEQAHNEPLDGRSDLFSLAVCVYEALTGERLFTGDLHTPPEQVYGVPVPKLSARRPDVPFEIDAVMEKALARDRDERFQDAAAFAEGIRDVARRTGLLFSAPALAAELVDLLGPNPDAWATDDANAVTTEKLPLGKHVGREATGLGLAGGRRGSSPSWRALPSLAAPAATGPQGDPTAPVAAAPAMVRPPASSSSRALPTVPGPNGVVGAPVSAVPAAMRPPASSSSRALPTVSGPDQRGPSLPSSPSLPSLPASAEAWRPPQGQPHGPSAAPERGLSVPPRPAPPSSRFALADRDLPRRRGKLLLVSVAAFVVGLGASLYLTSSSGNLADLWRRLAGSGASR